MMFDLREYKKVVYQKRRFLFGVGGLVLLFAGFIFYLLSFNAFYLYLSLFTLPLILYGFTKPSFKTVLNKIKRIDRSVFEKIKNAFELNNKIDSKENYSEEFIHNYQEKVKKELLNKVPTKYLSINIKNKLGILALSLIFIIIVIFNLGKIKNNLIFLAGTEITFYVVYPEKPVEKDSLYNISVEVKGPPLRYIYLKKVKERGGERINLKENKAIISKRIKDNSKFYFHIYKYTSKIFNVYVKEPLYFTDFTVKVKYPSYMDFNEQIYSDTIIYTPYGSRVRIIAHTKVPIKKITTTLGNVRIENRGFNIDVNPNKDLNLHIAVLDTFDRVIDTSLSIVLFNDKPPEVNILFPSKEIFLNYEMKVKIIAEVMDDIGIDKIWLRSNHGNINLYFKEHLLDTIFYQWNLGNLNVYPGDTVFYRIYAKDIKGQIGKSEKYMIIFPSMEDIVKTKENALESGLKNLNNIREDLEDFGNEFDKLSTTSNSENIENLMERSKQTVKEIYSIADKLDSIQNSIEDISGMDKDVIDKLNKAKELLKDVLSLDIINKMAEMAVKLKNNDPSWKKDMERLKADREAMLNALNNLIKSLEKYKLETRISEAIKKAKEASSSLKNAMFNKEFKKAKNNIMTNQKTLDSLLTEISQNLKGGELEQFNKIQDKFHKQMSDAMNSQNMDMVNKGKEGFENLSSNLMKMLEGMKKEAQNKEALKEVIQEGLFLSKEMKKIESNFDWDSFVNVEAALEQLDKKFTGLAEDGMNISFSLLKGLNRAKKALNNAANQIDKGNNYAARSNIKEAKRELDGVILQSFKLLTEGNSCPFGSKNFMQMIQSLINKQSEINRGMQGFMPIPLSGISQEIKDIIGEMLSKERGIRKSLEKMLANGEDAGMSGRIEQLIKDIKDIERDLSQLKIGRETIKRQNRVLKQFLEIEKAFYTQGKEEKRFSKSGKVYTDIITAFMPSNKGEENIFLKRLMIEALNKARTADEALMIKKYYNGVIEEK